LDILENAPVCLDFLLEVAEPSAILVAIVVGGRWCSWVGFLLSSGWSDADCGRDTSSVW